VVLAPQLAGGSFGVSHHWGAAVLAGVEERPDHVVGSPHEQDRQAEVVERQ
jgi:hypothetical protein